MAEQRAVSLWSAAGRARYGSLALVLVASGLFVAGLLLPVVDVRKGLSSDSYSVIAGIVDLARGGNVALALIIGAFSVVFPGAKLCGLLALVFVPFDEERRARTLRWLALLGRWSMLDVFVIVIMVGSIHLGVLSDGEAQPGIYVFAAAILLSMVATVVAAAVASRDLGADTVERLRPATKGGGWLSVAAAVLFVVALSSPLMEVEKWIFWDNEYSILRATLSLAREGEPVLAAVVLVFVVALPIARFAGLVWLRWGAPPERATRWLLALDKWSMLDVFGLALLIVLVKVGDLASVTPRAGFWLLLGAVALSLVDSWRLQRHVKT